MRTRGVLQKAFIGGQQEPVQIAGKWATKSGGSDASYTSNYRRNLETKTQDSSHPKTKEEDSGKRSYIP